jgi:hypothetical protein
MIVSHQPHYAWHVIDRREVIDQALHACAPWTSTDVGPNVTVPRLFDTI